MNYKVFILAIVCVIVSSCGSGEPDTVVVVSVGPKLPPLDCNEIANRAAGDVAARGLGTSPAGASVVQKARFDCERENSRRGY